MSCSVHDYATFGTITLVIALKTAKEEQLSRNF